MSVALLAKRPVQCMQRCRHSYLDRVECSGDGESAIVRAALAVVQELLPVARLDLLQQMSVAANFDEEQIS